VLIEGRPNGRPFSIGACARQPELLTFDKAEPDRNPELRAMSDDLDKDKAVKLLVEALGQAQAFNRANSYILMEVVRDLARTQADPETYLAEMLERINARADQGRIEKDAHAVDVEFRDSISRFFLTVGQNLNTRG
jgi:hypothetical protein